MFDGNDSPHELLQTTRQKKTTKKCINNNMSTDSKLSKAQMSKIIQFGEFLGILLSKLAGPLMKAAIPLARNVLALLGIIAAASAIDARITKKKKKKIHGSGTTTFIIWNEEMNDIMKTVQALEDSSILLNVVSKTIKNETKEQKGGFLSMLLGTLWASLLGNLLAGKGILRTGSGNRKGKGIARAGSGKKWDF